MVSRSKVRQCRSKKSKSSGVKEQQKTFEQENIAEHGQTKTPTKKKSAEFQKLGKQQTASTLEKRISVKEEAKDDEENFESSDYESSRFEHSSSKKADLALTDPMWRYYPKQVQNVLK
jgi:RNA recognition motif-containing protein